MLYVEVQGVQVSGLERLRSAAFKALPRNVELNGDRRYRLVPGTAADGLILTVPDRVDYPPPFNLDQDVGTIEFTKGGEAQHGGDIRLRFYALPVR